MATKLILSEHVPKSRKNQDSVLHIQQHFEHYKIKNNIKQAFSINSTTVGRFTYEK